jgi:hypothetical protein
MTLGRSFGGTLPILNPANDAFVSNVT